MYVEASGRLVQELFLECTWGSGGRVAIIVDINCVDFAAGVVDIGEGIGVSKVGSGSNVDDALVVVARSIEVGISVLDLASDWVYS